MRIETHIQVRARDVGNEVFEGVCTLYPTGRGEHGFWCKLYSDDPDVARIVTFLEARGINRNRKCIRGCFKFQLHRFYEDSDILASKYSVVFPNVWFSLGETGGEKRSPLIGPNELPVDFQIGFVSSGESFVSDALKEELEKAEFVGPRFRSAPWLDSSSAIGRQPIWQLFSTITLPKLANVQNLVHVSNAPFEGDYSRIVWVREEPFEPSGSGELHYRATELCQIEPFDLAQTFELHRYPAHTLVASQRFFEFCRNRRLPIKWQPVRLDAE